MRCQGNGVADWRNPHCVRRKATKYEAPLGVVRKSVDPLASRFHGTVFSHVACSHMATLYKSGVWRMFHLITPLSLSNPISVLFHDWPRRLSRSQIWQGTCRSLELFRYRVSTRAYLTLPSPFKRFAEARLYSFKIT